MKKSIVILILFALLFLCSSSCCMFYDIEDETYEGHEMCIGFAEKTNCGFIGYVAVESGDGETVVLPDEYRGIPITELGGYMGRGYPCPFLIEPIFIEEDEEHTVFQSSVEFFEEKTGKEYLYRDIVYHVVLPKHLKEIVFVHGDAYYFVENNDEASTEPITVYRILYEFEMDEENPYFYTEDGKLYEKKTSALVDDFLYE